MAGEVGGGVTVPVGVDFVVLMDRCVDRWLLTFVCLYGMLWDVGYRWTCVRIRGRVVRFLRRVERRGFFMFLKYWYVLRRHLLCTQVLGASVKREA